MVLHRNTFRIPMLLQYSLVFILLALNTFEATNALSSGKVPDIARKRILDVGKSLQETMATATTDPDGEMSNPERLAAAQATAREIAALRAQKAEQDARRNAKLQQLEILRKQAEKEEAEGAKKKAAEEAERKRLLKQFERAQERLKVKQAQNPNPSPAPEGPSLEDLIRQRDELVAAEETRRKEAEAAAEKRRRKAKAAKEKQKLEAAAAAEKQKAEEQRQAAAEEKRKKALEEKRQAEAAAEEAERERLIERLLAAQKELERRNGMSSSGSPATQTKKPSVDKKRSTAKPKAQQRRRVKDPSSGTNEAKASTAPVKSQRSPNKTKKRPPIPTPQRSAAEPKTATASEPQPEISSPPSDAVVDDDPERQELIAKLMAAQEKLLAQMAGTPVASKTKTPVIKNKTPNGDSSKKSEKSPDTPEIFFLKEKDGTDPSVKVESKGKKATKPILIPPTKENDGDLESVTLDTTGQAQSASSSPEATTDDDSKPRAQPKAAADTTLDKNRLYLGVNASVRPRRRNPLEEQPKVE